MRVKTQLPNISQIHKYMRFGTVVLVITLNRDSNVLFFKQLRSENDEPQESVLSHSKMGHGKNMHIKSLNKIVSGHWEWKNYYFHINLLIQMCVHAKLLQSCPTFCNPMNCSPPGSSVHGILQARILKWVVIPFSRGLSRPRDLTQVSSRFFTI